MKRWAVVSLLCFAFLGLLFYGCGGGGGSGESSSSGGTSSTATGSATLTGIVGTGSTTRNVRATASSVSEGKVTLVVDLDGDGSYGSSGDKTYEGVIQNGKFSFSNVAVRKKGKTKAKLSVEANNKTPYEKIIELENGGAVTVKPDLVPVDKVTAEVNRRAGGYLIFGIKKTADGTRKAFVKRSSRADVNLNGTESEIVVPVANVPEGVTQITASLKHFDGNQVQQFPGEFRGTGYTKANDKIVQLKSIAFLYADFTDQNGQKVNFKEGKEKRDGTCSNLEVVLNVPADQLSNLTDDVPNNDQYDVPVWRYNPDTGLWEYITEGQLYDSNDQPVQDSQQTLNGTNYYVKACLPPGWSYCNLDYGVWVGQQPKEVTICVNAKDQNGNPVPQVWVYGEGSGNTGNTWVDGTTDANGTAKLNVSIPANTTDELTEIQKDYDFYYEYYAYGWMEEPINDSQLTKSQTSGCDYDLNVTIQNPFDAKIQVKVADKDGNPLKNKWVEIWDDNYYYNSKQTDQNGQVTFDVKSDTLYYIYAINQEKKAEVNFNKDYDETSDNGQVAEVIIQKQGNSPPQVYTYLYPEWDVKAGTPVTAYVYAYDVDGDNLTLKSATFGNKKANCQQDYAYAGYAYWTCSLDTTDLTGKQTFEVTVSDGHDNGTASASQTINIVSGNRPPQVYGIDITDNNGRPVYDWNALKLNTQYTFTAYAWDPDGDQLTYSWQVDGQPINGDAYTFTKADNYTITVIAKDDQGATDSYSITVYVGNAKPVIVSAGYTTANPQPGGSLDVFAYAYDPDGTLTADSFSWQIDGQTVTPDSPNYDPDNDYYTATLTLPDESKNSFKVTLTVTDKSGKTATYSFKVWTNKPPVIDTPLPSSLTLNEGDSHTFTVSAHDPNGDELTYEWYVKYGAGDWQQQSASANSFTYTFNNTGTYAVKVVVSDGIASVVSVCQVKVQSGAVTSKLILHTGLEGLYVAIHDPDTLQPISTKQTDANGNVEFDNINGNIGVSISFTPDVVMNKDMLFGMVVFGIRDEVYNWQVPSDVEQELENGKVKVADFKKLVADDSTISDADVDNADTNGDDYLDKNEIYQLALNKKDKNNDGKIEIKEVNDDINVKVDIVRSVPAGEYDLTDEYYGWYYYGYDYADYYGYGYYAATPLKQVSFTIKNVPGGDNIEVYGGDGSWASVFNNNSTTADVSGKINLYKLQDDGTYSLIFGSSVWDENSQQEIYEKYAYLLDQTADSVTVDYNDFKDMKVISIENAPSEGYLVGIYGKHKGVEYWMLKDVDFSTNTVKVPGVPFEKWRMEAEYKSGDNSKWVTQVMDKLPDSVDMNALPWLDVTITKTDTGFSLTGNDLDKVNDYWYGYWNYKEANDIDYGYDIDIDAYGNPSSTFNKPDFSKILPQKVWNYVQKVDGVTNATSQDEEEDLELCSYPGIQSLNDWIQAGVSENIDWMNASGVEYHVSSSKGKSRRAVSQTWLPFRHSLFHHRVHDRQEKK